MALLSIRDLRVYHRVFDGYVQAVDGVSLDINEAEIVGLAGESGCGKSTLVNSIIRVLNVNTEIIEGTIRYKGNDLVTCDEKEMRGLRWNEISLVPQAAMDALDPVMRVENQFLLVARNKDRNMSKKAVKKRAKELFALVGLNGDRLRDYPHQFSGGMKQRVIIALSLLFLPNLVLMDEPVTALDVIVQSQILNYIKELQKDLGISIFFVTHDISVLAKISDRIYIMYAGKMVEAGRTRDLLDKPFHPYTIGLKKSFPNLYEPERELISIPGSPPNLLNPPPGCRFAQRCPFSVARCKSEEPGMEQVGLDHYAACYISDRITEKLREKAFLSQEARWRSSWKL